MAPTRNEAIVLSIIGILLSFGIFYVGYSEVTTPDNKVYDYRVSSQVVEQSNGSVSDLNETVVSLVQDAGIGNEQVVNRSHRLGIESEQVTGSIDGTTVLVLVEYVGSNETKNEKGRDLFVTIAQFAGVWLLYKSGSLFMEQVRDGWY
jgi:hypothetical protein